MSSEPMDSVHGLSKDIFQRMLETYWGPMFKYMENNPSLINKMPGFLLQPEKIVIYVGRTHIGIEYYGPERISALNSNRVVEMQSVDCAQTDENILQQIIGFEFDSTSNVFDMPLPPFSEDLVVSTNRGMDKLFELGWNFTAQSAVTTFNTPCPSIQKEQFTRIVNGIFFDANKRVGLISRHIKWLDLIPIKYIEIDEDTVQFKFSVENYAKMIKHDATFDLKIPEDYKYSKLPIINRFIELWGNRDSSEPKITSFISEPQNRFILTMKFGAKEIYPQINCEWQSENRPPIVPDFFVLNPNGFADIVEFKLPLLHSKTVVGIDNRETFSAFLNSYISQTRVYASYFDDPNNRKWFKEKNGFDVYKPKRWLVVGRRSDFKSVEWREILADYRDIEIITYDDLIDGVAVQFYK